jgi:iron complex outermembrane receptor protein
VAALPAAILGLAGALCVPVAWAQTPAAAAAAAAASGSTALPELVVTATRFPETLASLPMGVSVITAEQIRVSGVTTVNEAIMRLLGVPGRQDFLGGGNFDLDLRGFGETAGSNQVIVLDGVRLNEADMSQARLAGINIDTVERIEVLRGSGAVLYGEGATGGVIVITTKAGMGRERQNSASLFASVGTYDTQVLRASATLAAGGFSLDVAGQERRSDNHRDNFQSSTEGLDLVAQWAGDSVRLGLRHGRDTLDTRLPGPLTFQQFLSNPRQTITPNESAAVRNERSGVFGEWFAGAWQLGFDAGSRNQTVQFFTSWPMVTDVDADTFGLRGRHSASLGSGTNVFVLGYDENRWNRLPRNGTPSRHKSEAWYVKNDYTWATGTRLSVGARTEKLNKSTASVALNDRLNAWELGLAQPLAQGQMVWVRAGTSFRLANVDELNFMPPGIVLRPQESRDIEAGWRWSAATYRFEVRAYQSRLTNEIGLDPNFPNPFSWNGRGANVNFDPTLRRGIEADADWAVTDALNLGVRMGFRESTFRSGPYAGRDIPWVPSSTLALRADWQPVEGHRLSAGLNWVSSQTPSFANECRIPSYTTADVRYSVQVRSAELSLGVNNLFDRRYFTQAIDCAADGNPSGIYLNP